MKDSSIINVLLHMRLEAIRGDQAGLEHINALLLQKGYNPSDQLIPQHRPRMFKRGELKRAILAALRDGPKTGPEVIRHIAKANNINQAGLRMSVHYCLSKGKVKGFWAHVDGFWKPLA